MNEQIKKEWLEALRSKEYQQGTHVLKSGVNNFCCLGVLCDLHRKKHEGNEWEYRDGSSFYFCERQVLPVDVIKWAYLNDENPTIAGFEKEGFSSLAELNDNGKSFEEIADVIENQL